MGFRRCLPVGIQLSMWKQLTLSCRRDEEAGREGAAPTAEAALCIRMRGEGGDYTRDLVSARVRPSSLPQGLSEVLPRLQTALSTECTVPRDPPLEGIKCSPGTILPRLTPSLQSAFHTTDKQPGGTGVAPQSLHRQKACWRQDSNSSPLLRPLFFLLQHAASPAKTQGAECSKGMSD